MARWIRWNPFRSCFNAFVGDLRGLNVQRIVRHESQRTRGFAAKTWWRLRPNGSYGGRTVTVSSSDRETILPLSFLATTR